MPIWFLRTFRTGSLICWQHTFLPFSAHNVIVFFLQVQSSKSNILDSKLSMCSSELLAVVFVSKLLFFRCEHWYAEGGFTPPALAPSMMGFPTTIARLSLLMLGVPIECNTPHLDDHSDHPIHSNHSGKKYNETSPTNICFRFLLFFIKHSGMHDSSRFLPEWSGDQICTLFEAPIITPLCFTGIISARIFNPLDNCFLFLFGYPVSRLDPFLSRPRVMVNESKQWFRVQEADIPSTLCYAPPPCCPVLISFQFCSSAVSGICYLTWVGYSRGWFYFALVCPFSSSI